MTKLSIYKNVFAIAFALLSFVSCKSQNAFNGLQNYGSNIGLGGYLTQHTTINTANYNLSIKNDSAQLLLGTTNLYGLQFPFYGINTGKGYFGRLDLRSIGSTDQWTATFVDSARQSSNGLNVRKEQFSLSVYDNENIPARYEYGFTGYNTNADHFCFDRVANIDVTLLKAHKDYGRIQHYFDVPNQHFAEVMVNDKIYLQTDQDTAAIADGGSFILPNTGTSVAYFDNSVLKSGNELRGFVTQITNLTTGVTINKPMGVVRTVNAFLASGASSIFTITNSYAKANSIMFLTVNSSTTGTPYVFVTSQGNGWFSVKITNLHPVQTFNSPVNINFIIN